MNIQINTVTENGKTISKVKINGKKFTVDGNVYIRNNNVIDEQGRIIDDKYLYEQKIKNTINNIEKKQKDYFALELDDKPNKESVTNSFDIELSWELECLKKRRFMYIVAILWFTFITSALTALSIYYFAKDDIVWGVIELVLAIINGFLLVSEIIDLFKLAKDFKKIKKNEEEN